METNLQALWKERITAYQASGHTMKAWCEEHDLTVHQLKYWIYKTKRQAPVTSANTTFRPVAVAGRIEATESLQIQVGVARIDVRPGFEPGLLLFPDVCAYSFRVRQNLMKGMKAYFTG
ncbi:IS66 family insertion sequence element accessory protein TnpB [Paenibacillus dendritiformis]|uniref:IS66 family insertion sequence element accessory protein TnpA n=1 Tax=Paenibacillus dendritiformis TaxID=130049 RepID=UPI00364F041E